MNRPHRFPRGRQLRQLFLGATLALTIPLSLLIGTAAVLVATFTRTDTVHRAADLKQLHYGLPISWVSQDQTKIAPARYPHDVEFRTPHHSPTRWHPGIFVADVAIVSIAPGICFVLICGGLWLSTRRGPPLPDSEVWT